MTTSSVQTDYLTISSDTIDALTNVTISNGTGSSYYYTGAGIGAASTSTITISSGGTSSSSSGFTIGGAGTSTFNWKTPEEFVDAFPDYSRIQDMCNEYPALKIAFEKFKTTYKLVKDHYDTPEDQRPLP
jgi:hypothetical protein